MKNVHIVLFVCFAHTAYSIILSIQGCTYVILRLVAHFLLLCMVALLFNLSFIQAIFYKKYFTSSDVLMYADVRDMVT